MFDLESIILWLQSLPPLGVYAALFFTTYIENVFPPSPSDVVLLFIATLIGIGTISFVPTLAIATAGSITGFLTAFLLGRKFGRELTTSDRFPFLNRSSIAKVDAWFDRYGYGVIVINRFLAGTRAVVSFFAGMSDLDLRKTTFFCAISALAWNALVIELGHLVGANWERGEEILRDYGRIVMLLLGAALLATLTIWFLRKRRAASTAPTPDRSGDPADRSSDPADRS